MVAEAGQQAPGIATTHTRVADTRQHARAASQKDRLTRLRPVHHHAQRGPDTMHIGKTCGPLEFLIWTQHRTYALILIALTSVAAYKLGGWAWLAVSWDIGGLALRHAGPGGPARRTRSRAEPTTFRSHTSASSWGTNCVCCSVKPPHRTRLIRPARSCARTAQTGSCR